MENNKIIAVEDLLALNEMMLGRGVPVQEDGIGYNKADYGICSNYFYGLSDVQVADLAKRLVKYCKTQLGLDKEVMKETASYYESLVKSTFDRTDGVSVNVSEDGTHVAFKYNEMYVATIKSQPKRQYDPEYKQWVIPNENVLKALQDLKEVGADVDNAIGYVNSHPLCQEQKIDKIDVKTKLDGNGNIYLKFEYNKQIIDVIKQVIDKKDRKYNPQHKYWAINLNHFDKLKKSLDTIAEFKAV